MRSWLSVAALVSFACSDVGNVGSDRAPEDGGNLGDAIFPQSPPSISVLDAHAILGEKTAEVGVVVAYAWHEPIGVKLSTTDGTAIGDPSGSKDYQPVSEVVTIAPGTLAGSVLIPVSSPYSSLTLDASLAKQFETHLSEPTGGAKLADANGIVTLGSAGMVIETPLAKSLFDADIVPDFNGDKRADLVLSGRSATAAVLLTPGTAFVEASRITLDSAYANGARAFSYEVGSPNPDAAEFVSPDASVAWDFDQDGLSDVLVVADSKAHILYGADKQTFAKLASGDPALSDGVVGSELTDLRYGYGGGAIQTGDWDGDGLVDWAQANSQSSVAGGVDALNGYYGVPGPYPGKYTATPSFSFNSGTTPVGLGSKASATLGGVRADLQADGIDDIVFSGLSANDGQTGGAYLYVLFGTTQRRDAQGAVIRDTLDGTNGFQVNGAGSQVPIATDAGDVNGDGIDDLVVLGADVSLAVVFGKKTPYAKGTYSSTSDLGAEAALFQTDKVSAARIGDVNRDGIGDLVFIAGESLHVIWGKKGFSGGTVGGTKYPDQAEIPIDPNSGLDRVSVAGDLDGDGAAEIILLSSLWQENTGAALILFGSTLTRALGGANLEIVQ